MKVPVETSVLQGRTFGFSNVVHMTTRVHLVDMATPSDPAPRRTNPALIALLAAHPTGSF
jgi:hypothetical protein